MIDQMRLLGDLKPLVRLLEEDLPRRSESSDLPEIGQALRSLHAKAAKADRTGQSYSEWRADAATQMAAAWILTSSLPLPGR